MPDFRTDAFCGLSDAYATNTGNVDEIRPKGIDGSQKDIDLGLYLFRNDLYLLKGKLNCPVGAS